MLGYAKLDQEFMLKPEIENDAIRSRLDQLESLVETISRSKIMWESTFDVITDPVYIIDRDYNITRANKALANVCQVDIRDVIDKKCYQIFAGCDSPCTNCPVAATLSTHESHSVELEPFPNNKQYAVNAYTMPDLGDGPESIVLHYRNITEEKQLQKKLMHSEKMAAVGTLAGGVAHEVNNPIAGILAFTQLVLKQLGEGHECYPDLKEIEDAARRCKKIVSDLLVFSRDQAHEEKRNIHLSEVIQKTMSIIEMNSRSADVELVTELSEDLPPVQGDFNKLQQVVLNFVSNAMHAMKDSGGKLTVVTSCSKNQQKVFLKIKDTGVGIDKDLLDKIFNPYFTTKEPGEGTGLGLSICYKIIEEHKGKIDVQSKPGKGTQVTLQLPANCL
jgi:two-component system, NtrC family, sensor kinase